MEKVKKKPRKMPVRTYAVGTPVRYLAEVTVKATSRRLAEVKAEAKVKRRCNEVQPYVRRVK